MTTNEADENRANQELRPGNGHQSHPSAERRDYQAPSMEAVNGSRQLGHVLIDKFPNFDPTWPAEVQVKWFAGFERLMDALSGGRR
jgi:hypothetical protein